MELEELYRRHYGMVVGFLRGLGADGALAEALAAETFCRAVARIGQFDGRGRLSTWLCQIAKHLYFDECRRRRRQAPLEAAEAASSGPEDGLLERETAAELRRLAAALPEPAGTVFHMRLAGRPFREIGAALGRTEPWARVTYFRAKNQILKEWEGLQR